MKIELIKTAEPFVSLFPIDEGVVGRIADSMRKSGFDDAHPVIIWAKDRECEFVLIDGHTRLEAARRIGLCEIETALKSFSSEDEAVEYAIRCQRDRRNLTDADLLRWVGELQQRRRGRVANSNPQDCGFTAPETAAMVGVSERKVEQTRTVLEHADDQTKAAVLAGEKSINQAYNETQAKRGEPKKCKCGVLITKKGAKVCRFCSGEVKLAAPTRLRSASYGGQGDEAKDAPNTEERITENAGSDCGIHESVEAGAGTGSGAEENAQPADSVREAGGDGRVAPDGRDDADATGGGGAQQTAPEEPQEADDPRDETGFGSGPGGREEAGRDEVGVDLDATPQTAAQQHGEDDDNADGGEVQTEPPAGALGGSRPGVFTTTEDTEDTEGDAWAPEFRAALEGMAAVVRELKRGGWRRMSRDQAETAVRGLIELINLR